MTCLTVCDERSRKNCPRNASTDSFSIKSRPFDVKRHLSGLLYAKFRNGLILVSVFKFKTMQFWAISRKKIRRGIKIVHCINELLLERIATSKTLNCILRSIL